MVYLIIINFLVLILLAGEHMNQNYFKKSSITGYSDFCAKKFELVYYVFKAKTENSKV